MKFEKIDKNIPQNSLNFDKHENLPDECIKILTLYIQQNKSYFSKQTITNLLGYTNIHKVEYLLEILLDKRLITKRQDNLMPFPDEFGINSEGRKWLVKNNLL